MNNIELLKKYQKGELSLDEYVEILRTQSNKNRHIDLNNALAEKLDKEYKEFCNKIMLKDKKEIFNKAYEITVKDEIKEELKNMEMYDAEKEIIIAQDNILNEFYYDWLNSDIPLGDVLRCDLEESIATLTRYMGRKNNKKIDDER